MINLSIYTLVFLSAVAAKAIEKLDLNNSPKNFRTNYCTQAQRFYNYRSKNQSDFLSNSLKGLNITIGIDAPTYSDPFFMQLDNQGNPIGGFMYQIQQNLAAIGGFHIQYVQMPPQGSMDETTYYMQILNYVDFYGGSPQADNPASRAQGIDFTFKVADASLFIVDAAKVHTSDIWYWSKPFEPSLWAVCLSVCFLSGIIEYLIRETEEEEEEKEKGEKKAERGEKTEEVEEDEEEEEEMPDDWTRYMFYSFMTFSTTDPESGRAKNDQSRLAALGISFFCLILTATYTAKLAEQIIDQNAPIDVLSSITAAQEAHSLLCVAPGSFAESTLMTYYPGIRRYTTNEPTVSLAEEKCDAALISYLEYQIASNTAKLNPDCNLLQPGSSVRTVNGAWPYKADYVDKCTSYANDVLTALFLNLYGAGTMDTLQQQALGGIGKLTCPDKDDPISLSLKQMGGVFIVYAVFFGLALLLDVKDRIHAFFEPDAKHLHHLKKERPPIFHFNSKKKFNKEDLADDDADEAPKGQVGKVAN